MCLSVPAQIVSLSKKTADVVVHGQRRRVFLAVDKAKPGDWVLIHGPLALARLESNAAQETMELLAALTPKKRN